MFLFEKTTKKLDLYELAHTLASELLKNKCQYSHGPHHILFTANQQLLYLEEKKEAYRKFTQLKNDFGQIAMQIYQENTLNHHQLKHLIRAYMHLSTPNKREHFNHHFRFHDEKLEQLYEQLQLIKDFPDEHFKQQLYTSICTEFIPLVSQIE